MVEFLEEYRNLTLSIFTSRLYYFWDPNYQEGLCKLWDAGVQLDIMSCDGESRGELGTQTVGESSTEPGVEEDL